MPVYVDDMYKIPMGKFGRMKMSHLGADTIEELMDMADKIGVSRRWFQRDPYPHFDICMSKRVEAIAAGAKEVTMREIVKIISKKKAQ